MRLINWLTKLLKNFLTVIKFKNNKIENSIRHNNHKVLEIDKNQLNLFLIYPNA